MNHQSHMSAPPPQNGIATWDPNMAAENAVVDEAGVKWIDGKDLPIDGRVFDDVAEALAAGRTLHPHVPIRATGRDMAEGRW